MKFNWNLIFDDFFTSKIKKLKLSITANPIKLKMESYKWFPNIGYHNIIIYRNIFIEQNVLYNDDFW